MFKKISLVCFAFTASLAFAQENRGNLKYEVTITNLTKGQTFTPTLASTHSPAIKFFELGEMASEELGTLAESGNIAPLKSKLDANKKVVQTKSTQGLLAPGNSVTLTLRAYRGSRLSLASMLIPTNDTFTALNNARLPEKGSRQYLIRAYDAGTETNDELCSNIPGPACGGAGPSPQDDGEGYVHIGAGISGEADLRQSQYDWGSVVAKVSIRRIR